MKRLILVATFMAAHLAAQPITRIINLKYVDPQQIRQVIQMYGVDANVNQNLRVISIRGNQAEIGAAEAAIKQYDVPPKNFEMVVHFVVGTNQPVPSSAPVPADVREVIAQLKNTFTFKDYYMLDTLTLRTRAGGRASTTGIVGGGTTPRLTHFSINSASTADNGTIRIDRIQAGLRIPIVSRNPNGLVSKSGSESANRVEYMTTGIEQDVDVKEGQKVVVGRAGLDGPEKALFLILTARVIQ